MGKRVQNFNLKNLETKVINLGYVGENVHTQIVIECSEVLWDYPDAVASMVVQPPRGDLYPVEVTREENNIIWEITASDVVYAGSGRVQLTFTNDGEIVKSAVGTTRISGSIEATGEAPEPLQNWMDHAEETAHQIALTAKDEVIEQIQDAAEEARESIPADYTELSDDVSSLKSALSNNLDYTYTEYPKMFMNPQSGGFFIRTTTNNVSLIVIPITPNTKYTVSKETTTVMRMCTANVSTPAYGQVWSNAAYHAAASNEPLTITSGAEDAYLYIQLWVSSDAEELQSVEANISSLIISYVVIGELKNKVAEIGNRINDVITIIPSPFRHKMFHDHLLIDKTSGVDVVIPSESIPYIQMSRRLGYDNCELNIHETSDGKYVVGHGSGGRFGSAFEHIDGTTDVSQVLFNSVTMDWIKANVRFKSLYPKYRVAPPTLEEALYECRVNHLIPFVTASSSGIVEIVENIMGKNNYIAYNGSRSLTDGIIYKYGSYTAVSDIKNDFDAYGPPFIYGFSNPEAFTDEQLIDIANYAHQAGCMVGFSAYVNMAQQQRLIGLGFDFGGTRFAVNDFESGNLCNLSGDIDFSDFTTTGTIDSDYTLRLSAGDTLSPAVTLPTPFLSKGSLHIRYTGTLTFSMGDYINTSIESDGSKTTWVSTYFMRQSPAFTLTAVDDVVIQSLTYKASRA